MKGFNTFEEVETYLHKFGFKKINIPMFEHYASAAFQKSVKDEVGKKYFIEAIIYDFSSMIEVDGNYYVEFKGQFYQKNTHKAINFDFLDWEEEDVQQWIEDLFSHGFLEYYEEWDDE